MSLVVQVFILFSSVFLGGILVELFKKQSNLKLLLSFSGGYLLTIIFTHILPETYTQIGSSAGYYILGGFLLQIVLEYFSKGVEHGHTHTHSIGKSFPLILFISLSIHAFIEAIPLVYEHVGHSHGEVNLFWGIFLHKVPVAVALRVVFKASGLSNIKSWVYLGVFGLMAPVGLIFGNYLTQVFQFDTNWIMAVAIGMFLHISTTIIFESSEAHKINFMKLISIIIGFALGVIVS